MPDSSPIPLNAPTHAATVTPLGGLAAKSTTGEPLTEYRGATTVEMFDALPNEIASLFTKAAVHGLGWLRRIAVTGEDRLRWLSGMVTNSVEALTDGQGAYNLVLNAQGRIQGDLSVWRMGNNLEIETTADQVESLLAHFDHFIIMDDVELKPLVTLTALGLTGPKADEVLRQLGLPVLNSIYTSARAELDGVAIELRRGFGTFTSPEIPHYQLWFEAEFVEKIWAALLATNATPVGSRSLDVLRITESIATYGVDIISRDLPQETNQAHALHFSKGCYLGQEIVERIHARGQVHRHLRALELTGQLPASGTELTVNDKVVGHITSAALLPLATGPRLFALGMVRAEAEIGNVNIEYADGGSAKVLTGPPTFHPNDFAA